MRVLILRQHSEALLTATALQAIGHVPIIAPMITIIYHRPKIPRVNFAAIIFTSSNAVRALCEYEEWNAQLVNLPIIAVGDSTAETAKASGAHDVISANGNAHDLIAVIAETCKNHDSILYAAAKDRAVNIENILAKIGIFVHIAILYESVPNCNQTITSQVINDTDIVQVMSRRTGCIFLQHLIDHQLLEQARKCHIHAISMRAAEVFLDVGFRNIKIASRPNIDGMMQLLDKIR